MKGLCAGLGEEKGFALGDFGEGNVRGGGIEKAFLEEADALPKLVEAAAAAPEPPPPKGLLLVLLAIALANGFDLAYEENPPKHTKNTNIL